VARAEALLPTEIRDVRRLLEEVAEERTKIAALRDAAERARAEAERLREERREKLSRLLEERGRYRTRAAEEARALVRRAEETLRQVEREARERRRVTSVSRGDLARQSAELARKAAPRPRPVGGSPPAEVRPGERYWAVDLEREVEVLRAGDAAGRVQVLQNGLRIELAVSALRTLVRSEGGEAAETAPRARATLPEVEAMSPEVDLRGLRADEALDAVDRAIDRALLAGLHELRLIHGKGTGALRAAVTEHCRRHPLVRETRLADQSRGGLGATEITLEA
jgi:DNA mismatch repair protein MutS2